MSERTSFSLTYSVADQSFARTKSIGILNVSSNLIHELAARPQLSRLTVLANEELRQRLHLPPGVDVRLHHKAADSGIGRALWDQWGVYDAARRAGNEWLLLPKGYASFLRPCPVRLAVFLHDVIQDHYDQHHPGWVPAWEAAYFRAAFRGSVRHAEVIFTPTEFAGQEIRRVARQNGLREPQVVCCGLGFHPPPVSAPENHTELLVISSWLPHKLTPLAVEYVGRWQFEKHWPGQVHWIGPLPRGLSLPPLSNWCHHDRMPEGQYRSLLNRTRLLLVFSAYEGFGMPPVEAVTAGVCPVFSDVPAMREVMAGCGCAFDNADYQAFAAAMSRALETRPAQIEEWSRLLQARHNWRDVVDRVIPALQNGDALSPCISKP